MSIVPRLNVEENEANIFNRLFKNEEKYYDEDEIDDELFDELD